MPGTQISCHTGLVECYAVTSCRPMHTFAKKKPWRVGRVFQLMAEAHVILDALIRQLESNELTESSIGKCWAPVPFFGDLVNSRVATLGINPSNQEFQDRNGNELDGCNRRFHTLKSLGIASWSETNYCHIQRILNYCTRYFDSDRNPNDRWFKPLDKIVGGTGDSFYRSNACHLDLVPYATTGRWTSIEKFQRSKLLCMNKYVVGQLLSISTIDILILNGSEVVKGFQTASSVQLDCSRMDDWTLHWKTGPRCGFAYRGVIDRLQGFNLARTVLVLGFNHNIPDTPGVSYVIDPIKDWIASNYSDWCG